VKLILFLILLMGGLVGSGYSQIHPGDLAVVAYNTVGTDSFAWVALRDMPQGTVIHFTTACVSNGWFRWGDHIGRAVAPGPLTWTSINLVKAGSVISWISGTQKCWSEGAISGGGPTLSSTGDQIFAYTGIIASNSAGPAPWTGDPVQAIMVYGLNFANEGWDNVTGGNLITSFIPAGLSVEACTAVHAGNQRNAFYKGPCSGSVSRILSAISNSSNWVASVEWINPDQWPKRFGVKPVGTFLIVQ
jgi:hypothetical protein